MDYKGIETEKYVDYHAYKNIVCLSSSMFERSSSSFQEYYTWIQIDRAKNTSSCLPLTQTYTSNSSLLLTGHNSEQ